MSSPCVLTDTNGDAFHITKNYVRYGNRILDASFIATVTVKKHKLLFNNFKQNTTMPVLTVPFKKESDARHALNVCQEFYESASCNPYYGADDDFNEVFLADAYGGVMHVAPTFLRYRNRIISTSDVQTAHVKGRRVLINHFKGNLNVPTMCVHFADKNVAEHALNQIESVLWNVPLDNFAKPDPIVEDEDEEDQKTGAVSRAMELLDKPADPAFLTFVTVATGFLFAITLLRMLVGRDTLHDEL